MSTPKRQPYCVMLTPAEASGLVINGQASFEVLPVGSPLRPEYDMEPDDPLIYVMLHSGRLSVIVTSKDGEGTYSRYSAAKAAELTDGTLGWLVSDNTRSTDCDGCTESTWRGWSEGGLPYKHAESASVTITQREYEEAVLKG